MEKRRPKRALDNFRTPKPQEIFTTVAIVCHRYERLAVLQNAFAIILLYSKTRMLLVAVSLACLEMSFVVKGRGAVYYFFFWNTNGVLYVIMYILKK